MGELRSTAERKADAIALLERQGHAWLATASRAGIPRLIAVATAWDGEVLVIATRAASPTARNLDETGVVRLAFGSPDDVVMIEAAVLDSAPASTVADEIRTTFVDAAGWDPADEGPDWQYFRLRPVKAEAYRGYGELQGRDIMRAGRWLA